MIEICDNNNNNNNHNNNNNNNDDAWFWVATIEPLYTYIQTNPWCVCSKTLETCMLVAGTFFKSLIKLYVRKTYMLYTF